MLRSAQGVRSGPAPHCGTSSYNSCYLHHNHDGGARIWNYTTCKSEARSNHSATVLCDILSHLVEPAQQVTPETHARGSRPCCAALTPASPEAGDTPSPSRTGAAGTLAAQVCWLPCLPSSFLVSGAEEAHRGH